MGGEGLGLISGGESWDFIWREWTGTISEEESKNLYLEGKD